MTQATQVNQTVAISLHHVRKLFGSAVAVNDVSLDVFDGEFFTLLGPSGSGKTTVLRMIAGFEPLTSGSILLDDVDVVSVPAFERNVNTVFQDYALFPHMTVSENVEYGLKVKRVARGERQTRAKEMLEVVKMGEFSDRLPGQLSGGQRQRVALARALVNSPKVLLLDEPLGALDLKLRENMQIELKAIQQRVGITFVYVTHDQSEALSMSDRIAVFNAGNIEQIGTPRQIYDHPQTAFVAHFIGLTNLFVDEHAKRIMGENGVFTLRPERITVASDLSGPGHVVTIADIQYLGADCRIHCVLDGGTQLVASVPSSLATHFEQGQTVKVAWDDSAIFAISTQ